LLFFTLENSAQSLERDGDTLFLKGLTANAVGSYIKSLRAESRAAVWLKLALIFSHRKMLRAGRLAAFIAVQTSGDMVAKIVFQSLTLELAKRLREGSANETKKESDTDPAVLVPSKGALRRPSERKADFAKVDDPKFRGLLEQKLYHEGITLLKQRIGDPDSGDIASGRLLYLYTLTGQGSEFERFADEAFLAFPCSIPLIIDLVNGQIVLGRVSAETHSIGHMATILEPSLPQAWINLSGMDLQFGLPWEAERHAKKGIALLGRDDPAYATNLANAIKLQGRINDSLVWYRKAKELRTEVFYITNYLLALQYAEGVEADEIAREHRAFGDFVEGELLRGQEPFRHKRGRPAKLRVGFVSGDFRNHSVAYFIEPLLANYDRSKFEVTLYYSMAHEDAISQRLAKQADRWVNVATLDDRKFAQRVYEDQVDILIDLSGHTGRNRLVAFAYKPAPMQVTWLGHPNTTGLRTIDYRVTDAVCDPQGVDYRYSEKLLRLPEVFCCYRPMIRRPEARESAEYAVKPTPALRNGYITFGTSPS
jgi:tetratricopeptide (TPR) repeat protein